MLCFNVLATTFTDKNAQITNIRDGTTNMTTGANGLADDVEIFTALNTFPVS